MSVTAAGAAFSAAGGLPRKSQIQRALAAGKDCSLQRPAAANGSWEKAAVNI